MKIEGLPKHLENYSIAVFDYFATGEGITTEVELLCNTEEKPSIGWEGFPPNIIPAVLEKKETLFGKKHVWLEWNPKFKAVFFENFGIGDWQKFQNCCVGHGSWMNLVKKLHYNLS